MSATLEVAIQNTTRKALPGGLAEAVARALSPFRRRLAGREITIRIVGDRAMRAFNRRYKKHDYATDILTFEPGDILVSRDTARRQAAERRHTVRREIAHLVVHGALHLAGWRDDTAADREAMDAETERILDGAGIR